MGTRTEPQHQALEIYKAAVAGLLSTFDFTGEERQDNGQVPEEWLDDMATTALRAVKIFERVVERSYR